MIFTVQVVDWQQSVLDNSQPVSNHVWKHTMKMLDLLRQHDITATFFIENKVAIKYPVLVRKILAADHEVACLIDKPYNKDTFQHDSKQAIENLQDIAGEKIIGIRTREINLRQTNFDNYCTCLQSLGIKYDSSISTNLSVEKLEDNNPSMGAFKAYDIALYKQPVIAALPGIRRPFIGFGGSSFRLLPYELSAMLAGKLDRQHAVFHIPVYDMGVNEYTELKSGFQLPWRSKLDFYNRNTIADKLHKLFGDFPFDSFANQYDLT